MSGTGAREDGDQQATEQAIAEFRVAAERTIGAWSDAKLDAVIARLRQEGVRKPDSFALLMFLEDARVRRHEMRAHSDGRGALSTGITW